MKEGGGGVTSLPEPLTVLKQQVQANKAKVGPVFFSFMFLGESHRLYGAAVSKASENKIQQKIKKYCSIFLFLIFAKGVKNNSSYSFLLYKKSV